jgi:glutathione peroxidase
MPLARLPHLARGATLVFTGAALILPAALSAKPEFAAREMKDCLHCHVTPGGARNFRGLYYDASGQSFKNFDEVFEAKAAGVKPESRGDDAAPRNKEYPKVKVAPALAFTMKDIDGKPVNLGRYQGQVVLMVNVASQCGLTPQYAALQELYTKYKDKGFVVLGFPSNEFGNQEPGTEKEIKEFCSTRYKVTFPMFSKLIVKGEGQAPLYKHLTDKKTNEKFAGDIEWNFQKFLLNRQGEVVARFSPKADPLSPEVLAAIEKELKAEPAGAKEEGDEMADAPADSLEPSKS